MKTKITNEELRTLSLTKSISEIAEQFGTHYDTVRKRLKKLSLSPKENVKPVVPKDPLQEHKEKTIERYDKQFVNKLLKERTDRDIVTDILTNIVPRIDFTPKPLPERKPKNNKEIVVLNLNDVHIGRYSRDLLQKKADYLVSSALEIVEIQRGKATIDELVINMVGDIVDGDGIFPNQPYEQKFYLMEQMFGTGLPVISGMINELSNHFKKVTLNCVWGNHGRVSKFTDPELNFDHIFYKILEIATQNNPRLTWNISKKWYMIAKISKFGFLLTHGHFIKTWLNIPFYGIKEKGMRWQGSLSKEETVMLNKEWVKVRKEFWDFIVMGHFHTSLYFRWNNWRCILGGTWLDSDDFAESVLGLDSATEQTLFAVHEKRGITWMRNIDLTV
jgi:predicted phosphodiesterase